MRWLRSATSVMGAPPVMEGKDGAVARLLPRWSEVSPALMSSNNEDADIVQAVYDDYLEQGYLEPEEIPEQVEQVFGDEYRRFRSYAQVFTNPLRVYRMVRLRSPDDLRLDPIGEYWSWDARSASPYGYDGYDDEMPNDFLLVGEVAAEDVDWLETALRNTVRESEREISVKRRRPIRLLGILDKDGKVVSTDVREARANPKWRRR